MPEHKSADQTLPSVIAAPGREGGRQVLTLTIVFHPDTSRIGETAVFEKPREGRARVLGRDSPGFGRPESNTSLIPLNDRYVSREALQFHYSDGSVWVQRKSSSSRAHLGACELSGEARLSRSQLDVGVAIVLGGRVVVLLRRAAQLTRSLKGRSQGHPSLCGSSAYMNQLKDQISSLAMTNLDILIQGETGTGKELVAEAVHAASEWGSQKMIAVNMAAIPVALASSLLFGSVRGAFTGADKASQGYFRQAQGSTLFLDEIGDTQPETQAQLLRALQQREIQVVGGRVEKVNLRVISATDAQLEDQSGNFKAALRHRLAESEIVLLPLRQHPEDIGELLFRFVKRAMKTLGREQVLPHEQSTANEVAMWADLFHQFVAYTWPGNIRELHNYAQQVALSSEFSAVIPESVLARLSQFGPAQGGGGAPECEATQARSEDYSDREFLEGYKNARYEVLRTARQLGISRQAVYRRILESPGLSLASELSDEQVRTALENYGDDLSAAAMQLRVSRTALRERIRCVSAPGSI